MLSFSNHDINPQSSSPLFTRLPAEIRNSIFSLACTATYDKSKPYSSEAYYYRPYFRYPRSLSTSLPLVCRSSYLETHSLLAIQNTYIEWQCCSPEPAERLIQPHRGMSSAHLFMGQIFLEDRDDTASRLNDSFDALTARAQDHDPS